MNQGTGFHRVNGNDRSGSEFQSAPSDEFAVRLRDEVTERFHRITELTTTVLPIAESLKHSFEGDAACVHPLCVAHEGSAQCRESLDAHLEELRDRPGVHWHRCPFGKFCGFVPVVHNGACLAACKLVCEAVADDDAFEHNVELLAVLVENFAARSAAMLNQLAPAGNGAHGALVGEDGSLDTQSLLSRSDHPRIREIIEYVGQRLTDPALNVGAVAAALQMNAAYVAHLFVEQTGVRLSRYIAARRVELAKHLLQSSNRQIKRVAFESGHANADWFSQIFRAHTGMTPREFRRQAAGG